VSAPSSTDRRVLRTRRALRKALLSAIAEQGWEAISVQNLCARAGVGRSTFYTHFADKEELLLSGLDDLQVELHRAVAQNGGKPLAFVQLMIEHVQAHGRDEMLRLRALLGKRSGQVVLRRLTEMLVEVLDDEVAPLAAASPQRNAAVRYLAGALAELFSWWSRGRSGLSPAELGDVYRRLALSTLPELKRRDK
jgi:AcrR family transcriptional regulator